MSASRKRKAPTPNQVTSGRSSGASPLEKRIKDALTTGVKRRLGLPEHESVPDAIQGLLDSAAREVAESSVATAVVEEVTQLRAPSLNLSIGKDTASKTVDAALLREAERLAAKKKALRVAGFSNDEAMRILVAEVTGLASQARVA